jgi:hypothetical protein
LITHTADAGDAAVNSNTFVIEPTIAKRKNLVPKMYINQFYLNYRTRTR